MNPKREYRLGLKRRQGSFTVDLPTRQVMLFGDRRVRIDEAEKDHIEGSADAALFVIEDTPIQKPGAAVKKKRQDASDALDQAETERLAQKNADRDRRQADAGQRAEDEETAKTQAEADRTAAKDAGDLGSESKKSRRKARKDRENKKKAKPEEDAEG